MKLWVDKTTMPPIGSKYTKPRNNIKHPLPEIGQLQDSCNIKGGVVVDAIDFKSIIQSNIWCVGSNPALVASRNLAER